MPVHVGVTFARYGAPAMERAQDPIVWLGPQGDPLAVMLGGQVLFVSGGSQLDPSDAVALLDEMKAAEYYQLRRATRTQANEHAAAHTADVIAGIRNRLPD